MSKQAFITLPLVIVSTVVASPLSDQAAFLQEELVDRQEAVSLQHEPGPLRGSETTWILQALALMGGASLLMVMINLGIKRYASKRPRASVHLEGDDPLVLEPRGQQ